MLSPVEELRMPSDEWIKTLPDGRRVKFTYQELPTTHSSRRPAI